MTEREWNHTNDALKMLSQIEIGEYTRKSHLHVLACCRLLDNWIANPRVFAALDAAAQFADEQITEREITKWQNEVVHIRDNFGSVPKRLIERVRLDDPAGSAKRLASAEWVAHDVVAVATSVGRYGGWQDVVGRLCNHCGDTFGAAFAGKVQQRIADLFREIFGPILFRQVPFSSSWRTDTAVTLAHTMYDSRDFSAMPILADALQDAGCDNADILDHCRATRLPHVRGCWVVDLVLGKE